MLITFLLGIYRDVTSGVKLCLLLFVGTWERESPAEVKKQQVTNHGNVRGCCLVVYNASGHAFTVNSYEEVFVSMHLYPPADIHKQVAAEQVYVSLSNKAALVLLYGTRWCGRSLVHSVLFFTNG